MKVLVTGGNGFIGQKLAVRLLSNGLETPDGQQHEVRKLILSDVREAPVPIDDSRVFTRIADIGDRSVADSLIAEKPDVIFHLAAVVSGQAEAEFDLGLRINLLGTLNLLEACREFLSKPIFVFSSSCGIYGGKNIPEVLLDSTTPMPQTSYGSQKYAGEILVTDYSRKGFIDGRSLRLPTVVVRPGKANAAASSFVSAIIREPLNGDSYSCPVPKTTRMWVTSPRTVVDNICHTTTVDEAELTDIRSILLPGFTVSVEQMLVALESVAGSEVRGRVDFKEDDTIMRIVETWPPDFETALANRLGYRRDNDFTAIIRQYMEDELSQ